MISAEEALERLRAGNGRFVAGLQNDETQSHHVRRMLTAERQSPFAIVLGCSDSRVPAEIIFDQGLGDLFVIRVAGNIVAPSQIGSVEFAVSRFDTPLVVVLGHSQCGAVLATLDYLVGEGVTDDPAAIIDAAVRANILASVGHLRHGSNLLEKLIGEERLRIVGAEYSLETGAVSFMEE
jgi:carbonic anhydrase